MRGWAFTSSTAEEEEDERTDVAAGAGRCGGLGWDGQRYHSDEVCVLSGVGVKSFSQMQEAKSTRGLDLFSSCTWQTPLQTWNRWLGGFIQG